MPASLSRVTEEERQPLMLEQPQPAAAGKQTTAPAAGAPLSLLDCGKISAAPMQDLGELLQDLKPFVVDEAGLNEVRWSEFLRRLMRHFLAQVFFCAVLVITQACMPWAWLSVALFAALLLHIGITGLAAIAYEILQSFEDSLSDRKQFRGHAAVLCITAFALAGALAAAYRLLPGSAAGVLPISAVVVLTTVVGSSAVVLREPVRRRSELYSSLLGTRTIEFDSKLHLYMLLKSLRWGGASIGFIRHGCSSPAWLLEVNGDKIWPDLYELVSIDDGNADSEDLFKQFQLAARRRKFKSDEHNKYADKDVQHFVHSQRSPQPAWRAQLRSVSYYGMIHAHWLFAVTRGVCWRVLLSLGPIMYVQQVWHLYTDLCMGTPQSFAAVDGIKLCGSEASCQEMCETLPRFVDGLHEALHISEAEMAFPLILLLVDVIVNIFCTMHEAHLLRESMYLRSMPMDRRHIDYVMFLKERLNQMLKPLTLLLEWWCETLDWLVSRPDFNLRNRFAKVDPEEYSWESFTGRANQVQFRPNGVLQELAKPILGEAESVKRLPLHLEWGRVKGFDRSTGTLPRDHLAAHFAKKLAPLRVEHGENVDMRVSVDLDIYSQEDWQALIEDLLAPGKGRYLETLLTAGQFETVGPILLGPYGESIKEPYHLLIPQGAALSNVWGITKDGRLVQRTLLEEEHGPWVEDKFKGKPEAVEELAKQLRDTLRIQDGVFLNLFPTEVEVDSLDAIFLRFHVNLPPWDDAAPEAMKDGEYSVQALAEAKLVLQRAGEMKKPANTRTNLSILKGTPRLAKVKLLTARTLSAWTFMLGAVVFPLVAPCMRAFYEDGEFFPGALRIPMVASSLAEFLLLSWFFWAFTLMTGELSYIGHMMMAFDEKTLAPPETTASAASPFDLYINEGQKTYKPGSPWWNKQWEEKRQNLENWRLSAGYLRVFVCAARLTSQGLLMAAAILLCVLLIFSLVQAWEGEGAFALDKAKIAAQARKVADAGIKTAVRKGGELRAELAEGVGRATGLVSSKAVREASRRLSSGVLREGAGLTLHAASGALGAALGPVGLALQGPLVDQLLELEQASRHALAEHAGGARRLAEGGGGLASSTGKALLQSVSLGDIAKITKTQVMTIVFLVIILVYSLPTIYRIARINDLFARHAYLMASTKVKHQTRQADRKEKGNRQLQLDADKEDEDGESGEETDDSPEPAEDPQKYDRGLQCYELTLDATLKSSQKNTFPITMFGFVINTALLSTWLLLAATPMFQQAKTMTPPLIAQACHRLQEAPLTGGVQDWMNGGLGAVNDGLDKADSLAKGVDDAVNKAKDKFNDAAGDVAGTSEEYLDSHSSEASDALRHGLDAGVASSGLTNISGVTYKDGRVSFNVRQFINETVCVPLVKWVGEQMQAAIDHATDKIKSLDLRRGEDGPGAAGRRLQHARLSPALVSTVSDWWQAHPGDPEAKLLIVRLKLADLQREADRQLLAARAVERTLGESGHAAALDLAVELYRVHGATPGSAGGGAVHGAAGLEL